ncbi:MAG: alpha/beta hydrolase [Bacteroidales bacterium]|nr:alpha/beta hydrolase [Bacteroidales bacterium]
MPKLKIENIELYYQVEGKGNPLLMIAGLGSDSQSWVPILPELCKYFTVITPDNRGVGRTKYFDQEISIQQIADDCIALIKHLGFKSTHLLGHSMGGFVAQNIAIRYPEFVSKLILASTSSANSERNNELFKDWVSYLESGMDIKIWYKNVFYWLFTKEFFKNENLLNEAIRYAIEYPHPQSKNDLKNQVKAISKFNCQKIISDIKSKTMIINGKEDILFTPEESKKFLNPIKEAKFSIIKNAAHSIFIENPRAFTDCVLEFLR